MTDTRIRLNVISEIAFSAENPARPIHIFRTGTHTDSLGRSHTYEPSDIQAILANFAAGKRKRPPITERHDFGRAVGRIARVWADASNDNLYAQPAWNKSGLELLANEVYDGFSCELDRGSGGLVLIGGTLTNYPAVEGLDTVTLEAPPLPQIEPVSLPSAVEETQAIADQYRQASISTYNVLADIAELQGNQEQADRARAQALSLTAPTAPMSQARQPDIQHPITQESGTMTEELHEDGGAQPVPSLPPITPPQFNASDPAVTAQVNAVVAQMTAQFEAQRQIVLEQAQAQFQRQLAEMQAQQQIQQYAQDRTTATLNRQQALPIEASALVSFLSSLNASQRTAAQSLLDRILEAGLVDFSEVGSAGDGDQRNEREQYQALVDEEVRGGKTRLEAIKHVNRTHPALYAAQSNPKGGR